MERGTERKETTINEWGAGVGREMMLYGRAYVEYVHR